MVFIWGYNRHSIMWSSCHSSFSKMLGLSHETFYLLDHLSLFNSILHLVNIILCFFYLDGKFLFNFWCLVWWKRLGLLHGNSHQLDHLSFSEFYLTADIILSTFFMGGKHFLHFPTFGIIWFSSLKLQLKVAKALTWTLLPIGLFKPFELYCMVLWHNVMFHLFW